MKNKVFHSVRMEIIYYVVISIVLSLLTTALLSFALILTKNYIMKGKDGSLMPVRAERELVEESLKNGENQANFRLKEGAKIMIRESKRFAWFVFLGIAACFVFFFAVYFLAFTKKITDYFNDISRGLEEVSRGNFDVVFEERNEDELSNIAAVLNKTTGEINRILTKERDEERNRKEFITSIAHDLRTPLTSVIGYLQLVMAKCTQAKEDPVIAEKNGEYIRVAYDKAMRLQGLIEDLFSFTKTDAVGIKPHMEEIDTVKLVEQLVDECYPSIQDAGLLVEVKKTDESMPLMVDGELMARAIANLLTNGIKYGKDGKKLIIELEKDREMKQIKIRVINYGRLIPAKEIEKIFDKFYRVEESRSTETGGTGLGLAIAQNIIGMHGGHINVKSDTGGTVFEICLPENKVRKKADEG